MNLYRQLVQHDADWSFALRVAEKPGFLRNAASFFAHSGDSWFWAIGTFLLWLFGNSFWKQWAVYEFFWICLLALIVFPLKFAIRRRRPDGEWGKIYRSTDPHSFPSGHAARAFLIAAIASAFGPPWLAIALWVWAPLVSLARVAMGVHYLSDIVAGMLLGLFSAWVGLQLSPLLFGLVSRLSPILLW